MTTRPLDVELEYEDAKGNPTRRFVTINRVSYSGGKTYLNTWDHGRDDLRTFRADRVVCFITNDGEVVEQRTHRGHESRCLSLSHVDNARDKFVSARHKGAGRKGRDPMAAEHVVTAFTEEQVSRLTGISRNQLRHWDRTGFFSPSLGDENRRLAHSRTYTFRDVVSLRVLHTLRNEVRIPLPHLREVKESLSHLGEDLWAKTTLYVLGRRVVIESPETGERVDAATGQAVLEIPIRTICNKTQKAVEEMWGRDPESVGRFEKRRGLAHSERVVAGTRVPTRSIRAFLEAGYSTDAILEEYPSLTAEDVEAVRGLGTAA